MKEQDRWLDERIRRSLGLWKPKVPDHLALEPFGGLTDTRAHGVHLSIGKKTLWLSSMAASVLLGIILLWFLAGNGESGIRIMIPSPSAPSRAVFPALPGIASVSLPKPDQYASIETAVSGKKQTGPKPYASPAQVHRIDMQLELSHKNIVIVWCQRSDFTLFEEKDSGMGEFGQ